MEHLSKEQMDAFKKVWSKVVAKAWSDPAFKQRLFREPKKVLQEHGMELPPDKEYRIFEKTDNIVWLYMPSKPGEEMSEEFLSKISSGSTPCVCDWWNDM